MIAAYIAFLVLGIVAYVLMAKVGLPVRIFISLAVFLIPSVALTVWIARVGDKPPPDAITIVPKPSDTSNSDSVRPGESKDN